MSRNATKLLVVSTTLDRGGAQRFTSTLLTHLSRADIQPHLCLLRPKFGFSIPQDVKVHSLNYYKPWHLWSTVRALRTHLTEVNPDVVLTTVSAPSLVLGLSLLYNPMEVRWIVRFGNSPKHHDRYIRDWIARRVYPRADVFVANADSLAAEVVRHYPFSADKLCTIYNPTDFTSIDAILNGSKPIVQRSDRRCIVAIGRLEKQKRYDVMLQALARLGTEANVCLSIAGDGPELPNLQLIAKQLHLEDRVEWLGYQSNPFALLASSDLYVLSSDHEGLPNALIEAQGLGVPAVATDCPTGPAEIIIPGKTGLLVPTGDADALAAAISQLLLNEPARLEMGRCAKEHARAKFSVDRNMPLWTELLTGSVIPPALKFLTTSA